MHIITILIHHQIIIKKLLQQEVLTKDLKQFKMSKAGISVCSGGIIGMGETWKDRAEMLEVLAKLRTST